jgi:adenylylsulfate kinase-like enzyme
MTGRKHAQQQDVVDYMKSMLLPVWRLAKRAILKGFTRKRAGPILIFTDIDAPYKIPESPELRLRTDRESPEQSLKRLMTRQKCNRRQIAGR